MNITFFIGNGFDLNLGLKTGYRDFLAAYVKDGRSNDLKTAINRNIDTWADLERELGIYAGGIDREKIDSFFSDKEDLENALVQYLNEVASRKLVVDQSNISEFKNRVTGFAQYLPVREQAHYKDVISRVCETINYVFIDFNYTEYIDQLYYEAKNLKPFGMHAAASTNYHDAIRMPLHIHGNLDDEMILGVNDATQVGKDGLSALPEIVEYMSKPSINNKLGNQRADQAKECIDKSIFICVYGMSLGITDKDWWAYIANWLEKSTDHRLVLFMYDDPSLFYLGGRTARRQDEVRRKFLSMVEMEDKYEQLSQQIVVQFNSTIFNFDSIKLEA